MSPNDVMLIAVGGLLTMLSLVAAYFIAREIINVVREITQEQRKAPRVAEVYNNYDQMFSDMSDDTFIVSKGDTGPLAKNKGQIQPLRDPQVVKQLIEHFEEGKAPEG